MRQGGTLTWLLGDHLGSATITADENGTLATEQTYTAWGQTRSGSVGTYRQYTGQISEPQLGIYFYNARYYDPYLTRFLSADTIIPQPGNPMAWDRYAYVWLSPINHNDPTGHKPPCEGTDEFGNCSRIRKILILACGDGLGRNCEGDYSSYGNEKPLSHFEKTYRERGYEVVYFGADSYINEDGEIVGPYGEALSEFILSCIPNLLSVHL